MRVNKEKLDIAMARACMSISTLQKSTNMPRATIGRILACKKIRPETLGKVAKALGIDVTEIIGKED